MPSLLWGLLPPYWKLLGNVPALQIPAHRIVWTCVLLALLITLRRGWGAVREALSRPEDGADPGPDHRPGERQLDRVHLGGPGRAPGGEQHGLLHQPFDQRGPRGAAAAGAPELLALGFGGLGLRRGGFPGRRPARSFPGSR